MRREGQGTYRRESVFQKPFSLRIGVPCFLFFSFPRDTNFAAGERNTEIGRESGGRDRALVQLPDSRRGSGDSGIRDANLD